MSSVLLNSGLSCVGTGVGWLTLMFQGQPEFNRSLNTSRTISSNSLFVSPDKTDQLLSPWYKVVL